MGINLNTWDGRHVLMVEKRAFESRLVGEVPKQTRLGVEISATRCVYWDSNFQFQWIAIPMNSMLVGAELLGRREQERAKAAGLTVEAIIVMRGDIGFAFHFKLVHLQNGFKATKPRLWELTYGR